MFTERLVSFETAKLAEAKGFKNYVCLLDKFFDVSLRPSQSLLQRWLREDYNLFIQIELNNDLTFSYSIKDVCKIYKSKETYQLSVSVNYSQDFFNTYEDALEEALQVALNMIEN